MKKLITWFVLWLLSAIVFKFVSIIGFIINFARCFWFTGNDKSVTERLADYFKILAVGEDQVAGSYLYSTEDWTISSYSYFLGVIKKVKIVYIFMKIIDFFPRLFKIQQNHCQESFEAESKELNNGNNI